MGNPHIPKWAKASLSSLRQDMAHLHLLAVSFKEVAVEVFKDDTRS